MMETGAVCSVGTVSQFCHFSFKDKFIADVKLLCLAELSWHNVENSEIQNSNPLKPKSANLSPMS